MVLFVSFTINFVKHFAHTYSSLLATLMVAGAECVAAGAAVETNLTRNRRAPFQIRARET